MMTIVRPAVSCSSFKDLISPLTVNEFVKVHFENQSLHFEGQGGKYDSTWTQPLSDLLPKISNHSVRLCRGQQEKIIETLDSSEIALELISKGWSLVVPHFEQIEDQIQRICKDLRQEFYGDSHAVLFVTPSQSSAFDYHYDVDNILVLQLSGQKQWSVGESNVNCPSLKHASKSQHEHCSNVEEVVLRPGDLLYVPSGTMHRATALTDISIHVTIGWHPLRLCALFGNVLAQLEKNSVQFRTSIRALRINELELVTNKVQAELVDLIDSHFRNKDSRCD